MKRLLLAASLAIAAFPATANEFPFTADAGLRRINELSDKQKTGVRLVSGGCRSKDNHVCPAMAGVNVGMAFVADAPGTKAHGIIVNAMGKNTGPSDVSDFLILIALSLEAAEPSSTKAERGDAVNLVLKSVLDKEGQTAESVEIYVGKTKLKMLRSPDFGMMANIKAR